MFKPGLILGKVRTIFGLQGVIQDEVDWKTATFL